MNENRITKCSSRTGEYNGRGEMWRSTYELLPMNLPVTASGRNFATQILVRVSRYSTISSAGINADWKYPSSERCLKRCQKRNGESRRGRAMFQSNRPGHSFRVAFVQGGIRLVCIWRQMNFFANFDRSSSITYRSRPDRVR
jgi:hypothetical protein